MDKLVQMGADLFFNKIPSNFEKSNVETAFHKELLAITGGKKDVFELDPMQKHNLFQLIQVSIDTIIPAIISTDYDRFTETRNVALGDKPIFTVSDPSFFKVATVAEGVNSVRSQRLDQGQLIIPTKVKAIKIADDLNRLLSGRLDWATMMNRVAMSFVNDIRAMVYAALKATYATRPTQFKENGTFDPVKFNTLVQRIQSYTFNSNVNVFGTKLALGKVLNAAGYTAYPGLVSQSQMEEINAKGYVANFMGTDLIELSQSADVNSTTYGFAVDNSYLFFLPAMYEKLVKVVYEGSTRMIEDMSGVVNADAHVEYTIFKRLGVGVINAGQHGVYQLS